VSKDDASLLPIPDFDHMTVGSVGSHIRSLDSTGVETLLRHEEQHTARAPVIALLRHRLDELHSGAEPSGGDPSGGSRPETSPGTPGGSRVMPDTQGPKVNPPSQGVPTNPAQPR
jgi:hypothetical protein